MRRTILTVIIAALLAIPAFAQEEGGGGDGAAGVGAGQTQVFTRVDNADPMDQVRTFLGKANIKLSGDQEKTLKPQVDAALKEAQEATERLASQAAPRGERGQRGGAANGGGQRRGGPGGFGPNNALTAELRRINDDLITKINAVLKPDQQTAFKKFRSDEVRKAGGFPALKLVMEEAGAAFTPEQEQQIQELYAEDARQRGQLMRESQGRPDPAKLDELEKSTLTKVARLLNPAQRKALLDSRTKAAQ